MFSVTLPLARARDRYGLRGVRATPDPTERLFADMHPSYKLHIIFARPRRENLFTSI